jgi:hypothetical protein
MVSKFANWALSAKSVKYTPIKNNPLYGNSSAITILRVCTIVVVIIITFAVLSAINVPNELKRVN